MSFYYALATSFLSKMCALNSAKKILMAGFNPALFHQGFLPFIPSIQALLLCFRQVRISLLVAVCSYINLKECFYNKVEDK